MLTVPYVCLYSQLELALSTMKVENMKSVEHEDDELNNDYTVDPLADPRLDKMDLFNMVDSQDRDAIMNSTPSFDVGPSDATDILNSPKPVESTSDSGSGE